jgi:osmotically-inducible protein OsmY
VTVSGLVESEKMQKKVEKVVKKVKGVKKIVNETKVRVGL